METIIMITNFLTFGLIVLTPILLILTLEKFNIKRTFLVYLLIGLIALGILILVFSWWSYESDMILLRHYGYNIDGINEMEFYGKVSSKNMEQVKSLETSIMGIGWPLKAIFGYVIAVPYLLFIYLIKMLIVKLNSTK